MKTLRIGIVAGEASGDLLGASLMQALQTHTDFSVEWVGVAGPRMQALGARSLYPIEALSVMGLLEVLPSLPRLLWIRRQLKQFFLKQKPDLFIGIDAPDFNLGLERVLKQAGIPTIHYVSPSIWAWREGRVHAIRKAVTRMLTLFPFEVEIYQKHHVDAVCVGHPLVQQLVDLPTQAVAREKLGLPENARVLALLPGSRRGEIKRHVPLFLETAQRFVKACPGARCVLPVATPALQKPIENWVARYAPDLPLTLMAGQASLAMVASDCVLVASGTATLECALLERPMVVAYRASWVSYAMAKRLLKIKHVALPNILLGDRTIVPEYLQSQACVAQLTQALLALDVGAQRRAFSELKQQLRHDPKRLVHAVASILDAAR